VFIVAVAVGEGDIRGVFIWLLMVIVASTDCAVKAFGGSYLYSIINESGRCGLWSRRYLTGLQVLQHNSPTYQYRH